MEDVLNCLVEEQFNGFLNIELKTDIIHYEGIEKKIVQQMKQKNWPFRYLYSSFYFPSLVKLKKLILRQKLPLFMNLQRI